MLNKIDGMKKFRESLAAGALTGAFAAAIVYLKGLNALESFAYFFFWMGASLIVFYTVTLISGLLKGLIMAEMLAVPVVILSIGSYQGDPLYYVILNIIGINAFLGVVLGYFSGLMEGETAKKDSCGPGVSRKIVISILAGAVAGMATLIPISLAHQPHSIMASSLTHMVMASIIISLSQSPLKGWLTGLIAAGILVLPLALIELSRRPDQAAPMLIFTCVLGAALGIFNKKYAYIPHVDTDEEGS